MSKIFYFPVTGRPGVLKEPLGTGDACVRPFCKRGIRGEENRRGLEEVTQVIFFSGEWGRYFRRGEEGRGLGKN